MKEPEKIQCHWNEIGYLAFSAQPFNYAKEYIRTDAFIEKACEWLQNHTMKELCMKEEDSGLVQEFIENFEDYMKGEQYESTREDLYSIF